MADSFTRTRAIVLFVVVASVLAPAATAAATYGVQSADHEHADLNVYQPHYIDNTVETERTGNYTTYFAEGAVLKLRTENFDYQNVTDFGIEEDAGSLKFESSSGRYVLDTNGQSGTYTAYWRVEKTIVETETVTEGNETTTKNVTTQVEKTYSARIKVDKTNLVHVSPSKVKQWKEDASNWSEAKALFGSVGDPGKPVAYKMGRGAKFVDFFHNPLQVFSGDLTAIVMLLFSTAGGWFLLAVSVGPVLLFTRKVVKERNEARDKLGDYENIDEATDEIMSEKRKRYLRERSWNDWFDDHTAHWLRTEAGWTNPWVGFREVCRLLSPKNVERIVVRAMANAGYIASVDRDDAGKIVDAEVVSVEDVDPDDGVSTDGGELVALNPAQIDSNDGVSTDGGAVVPADTDADLSVLGEGEFDDLLDALDASTLESDVLRRDDVELAGINLPVANTDADDDVVAQLNAEIPGDFETREQFADILLAIVEKTLATDYATEDGYVDPRRDVSNFLMTFASVGAESYEIPYLRWTRDVLIRNVDELDPSARVEQAVKEVKGNADD